MVALLTDILQPLLGKGVQIPVQLGNPLAGFRVDLLINLNRAVLPEGQRFHGSLLPVHPEGHFRVAHEIAILRIGMADGDHVRVNPFQVEGHHGFARFHAQIAVFAAGDFREQLHKIAVIQLHLGPSGLLGLGSGVTCRHRLFQLRPQPCNQIFNRVPVSRRKAECNFAALMVKLRGTDFIGLHEPCQKRRFFRSYRGLIVALGNGSFPALFTAVLNRLFLPGEQGAGPTLPGLRLNGRKGHRMKFPQLFNILLHRMGGDAAHLHTPDTGDGPGSQAEVQQGGGGLGVLTEHLKEIPHLGQHDIVGIRLFDLVVAVPPRRTGGFLMLCRLGRGRGFRFQRGGCCRGEQAELTALVLLVRGAPLVRQGTGRSRQPVPGIGRDLGRCALGRGGRALGLFCRLFLLTLRLQDSLRQWSKQRRFPPLIHPHIP